MEMVEGKLNKLHSNNAMILSMFADTYLYTKSTKLEGNTLIIPL